MTSFERDNISNLCAVTTQAQGLPQMNGAGMVRDMRAAASIDGDFAVALTSYVAGTIREVLRGRFNNLGGAIVLRQPSTLKSCSAVRLQREWRYAASCSLLRAQRTFISPVQSAIK